MSIKTRLKSLEKSQTTAHEPVKISWFIVQPGDLHPAGYTFAGQEFLRLPGETTDELQSRCSASVELSSVFGSNQFHPKSSYD